MVLVDVAYHKHHFPYKIFAKELCPNIAFVLLEMITQICSDSEFIFP